MLLPMQDKSGVVPPSCAKLWEYFMPPDILNEYVGNIRSLHCKIVQDICKQRGNSSEHIRL